jgi:hypothetical protein
MATAALAVFPDDSVTLLRPMPPPRRRRLRDGRRDRRHTRAGATQHSAEAAASATDLARRPYEGEERRRVNVEQGLSLVAGRAVTRQERDGLWAVLAVKVYQLLTAVRLDPRQYQTWAAGVIDRLLDQAPEEGAKGGGA